MNNIEVLKKAFELREQFLADSSFALSQDLQMQINTKLFILAKISYIFFPTNVRPDTLLLSFQSNAVKAFNKKASKNKDKKDSYKEVDEFKDVIVEILNELGLNYLFYHKYIKGKDDIYIFKSISSLHLR